MLYRVPIARGREAFALVSLSEVVTSRINCYAGCTPGWEMQINSCSKIDPWSGQFCELVHTLARIDAKLAEMISMVRLARMRECADTRSEHIDPLESGDNHATDRRASCRERVSLVV